MTEEQATASVGQHPVLLFDGVCNLCNGLVQFIIRRDPEGRFRFASLQSETGQELAAEAGLPTDDLTTAVLYHQGCFHLKSDMALEVARQLGGFWSVFYAFRIVPRAIRNAVYDWVARNRYQWFGKRESCMIPTPDLKARFLD